MVSARELYRGVFSAWCSSMRARTLPRILHFSFCERSVGLNIVRNSHKDHLLRAPV